MSTTYRTIVLTAAGCEATGGHVLGCVACGALVGEEPQGRDAGPHGDPHRRLDHWLVFNGKREVVGCHCGFVADLDSDCGWGDSVVTHLLEVR